jgi:hypothetical protein
MSMKIKLFDDDTKGSGSIDLEDGKYVLEIVEVDQNTAKSGRGRLQLRCKTLEGPVVGATAFDWWNLPEPSDKPDSYIKNFWKDATKAWPHIYNAAEERLDETALKGLKYRVTVAHEPDKDTPDVIRMRMKSHRFMPKGGEAPVAAAPASADAAKPPKFSQPG